jgi:rabenosyn-5
VLNQKFKALDVFESNDLPSTIPIPPSHVRSTSGPSTPEPLARPRDPEEDVTRTHWQKPTYRDVCADTLCDKRLAGSNGSVNCRKCGKLFCEDHTMYQMKLSRQAQHDPVRGVWCRVCETCYKSREGYNDNRGLERNQTTEFISLRSKTVDQIHLETSRLEKRLTKLTQLLASPPPPQESGGLLWSISGGPKNHQRALEQSVIAWEEDTLVAKCRFCQQEFSSYTFRRHHCRLCGRVVCGDPQTLCSTSVGLNVATGMSLKNHGLA